MELNIQTDRLNSQELIFDQPLAIPQTLTSKRLSLTKLSPIDAEFIFELVNTPDWLRFIGDRNVRTITDAHALVQRIINNPHVNYWVVRIDNRPVSIGIISFVKRDYLDFFDVGFAFLPHHTKQGYAYEASMAFMQVIAKDYSTILATTLKDNVSSIALLKKLGFQFDKQIQMEKEELQVYSISSDKFLIDSLTQAFFELFITTDKKELNLRLVYDLCLAETVIIKKSGEREEIYNLATFIEPRERILTDGTLTSFEEKEIAEETKITGRIAQRSCRYEKSGYLNGSYFRQSGSKFFQFIKTDKGWRINAVIWEDDL